MNPFSFLLTKVRYKKAAKQETMLKNCYIYVWPIFPNNREEESGLSP